jgi:hypothetical protein
MQARSCVRRVCSEEVTMRAREGSTGNVFLEAMLLTMLALGAGTVIAGFLTLV